MTYIQRNSIKPNKVYNYSLNDFSGGLNNRSEILLDKEASNLLNMAFTNGEVMEKRRGQRVVSYTGMTKPITYIDEYKGRESSIDKARWGKVSWGDRLTDVADYLVLATEGDMYVNGKRIFGPNSTIQGTSYEGIYYFVDGEHIRAYGTFPKEAGEYIRIEGTIPDENVLMRIVSPPKDYEPLDRSAVVGDILTVEKIRKNDEDFYEVLFKGDTKWYTIDTSEESAGSVFVDRDYVVKISEDGTTATLDSETKGVKHLEGITVYDYNQGMIWYEPCLMEIEDEFKGANVVPENTKFIVNHKGRIFTSGDREDDDNIFISDVKSPYYFPVGLPIQIPPDSDRIVGLIVYDDSVVIGREKDIYALRGETNRLDLGLELFNIFKLNTHTGFANGSSADHVHNYLFFLGSDGNMYSLSSIRDDYRVLSTQPLNRSIDIFKEPIHCTYGDLADATTHFVDDFWYVSIGDKVLVFSFRHIAWTMYDGFNARSFYTINNELHWGNDKGELVTYSRDFMDFGEPFYCFWSSRFLDLDEPSIEKHFKDFDVIAQSNDTYNAYLYAEFNIDYHHSSDINHLIPKHTDDSTINNINHYMPNQIGRRGRNIRFSFVSGFHAGIPHVDLVADLFHLPKVEGGLAYVRLEDQYYIWRKDAVRDYDDKPWESGDDDWVYDGEEHVRALGWTAAGQIELNQPMKIYQINFNYEFRGGMRV